MINVLIADDHVLFRQGFEGLLKTLNSIHKIYQAGNGNEVLEIILKKKIDLIFMDIRMPIFNGIESTVAVREKYPHIKIIAISMMDDKSHIENMFRAGADGYILKNVNFNEIQLAIQSVMDGEKYYSEEISKIISKKSNEKKRSIQKYPELTAREKEIVQLICQSNTNKKMGELLGLSEKTISKHREHIHAKLGLEKVVDLIFFALDTGIIKKLSDN